MVNKVKSEKKDCECGNALLAAPPYRVIIENVHPEIEGGRFPIKRVVREKVEVTADIFSDGHELLQAAVQYKSNEASNWNEVPMTPGENDSWRAEFAATAAGCCLYTIEAWIDRFGSWRSDFRKKVEAQQAVAVDVLAGAELIEQAAGRAPAEDARELASWARALRSKCASDPPGAIQAALDAAGAARATRYPDRRLATRYEKNLAIIVDREKARFSTWYEAFPRSWGQPGKHATFRDFEQHLPYIAGMGFDVLYLAPIHPIGRLHRKGKNNNPVAGPEDMGSPWAIGSEEGGHTAVSPQLGTLEDFRRLRDKARALGLEIALDLAFQCAPDHPWVKEHPEWFRRRPDGTIQFAENPPKKYQDIYPLDFETGNWKDLWEELKRVALFWIGQGVRIFRVDNPHTKTFAFWEWLIGEIKKDYPEVIFLGEAFTRPKIMYRLAKLGFTQSYTYFAWRNTKWELMQYFTELTQTDLREYFRPNLWPNTPDILTEYLQYGGPPAFMVRLVLAATLGASYGIYGPAFELCENKPREPKSEEYLNAEKYELRRWEIARPASLRDFIARVNQIRRENAPLQSNAGLRFHGIDNDQLIAYSKSSDDLSVIVLVVVNLDPYHTQSGWIDFPVESLGIDPQPTYQAHDLLNDARYLWRGSRNYIMLDPGKCPAHIFRVRRKIRTERGLDYFL